MALRKRAGARAPWEPSACWRSVMARIGAIKVARMCQSRGSRARRTGEAGVTEIHPVLRTGRVGMN